MTTPECKSRTHRDLAKRRKARTAGIAGSISLAAGFLLLLTGASGPEPEVIRVRVPAQDVPRLFPAGTELRVMTAAEFEAKVAAALARPALELADRAPRLIRARHHAVAKSGILRGTSELLIEPARPGPAEYGLEPWTPAIVPTPEVAGVIGSRPDGKPTLWVEQGSIKTIHLEWELEARKYSRGRGFVLRLPGGETSRLSLEIPQGWEPVVRRGMRRGPQAANAPGQNLWEVDAELGRIDLEIYDPDGSGQASLGAIPWLTSTTEVDLRGANHRPRSAANWTSQWQIALDSRNARPLEIDLDSGLELIDVQGPKVRGYRVRRQGQINRVEVRLDVDGARNSSAELKILAHVKAPSDGAWTIPAARPASAVWTGGTTTVLLDDDAVLSEWREKSGRRIYPPGASAGPGRRLVFESQSPGPAAELIFAERRAESSCEVHGQLYVGDSASRIECQLRWKIEHGPFPHLHVDLSSKWAPDRVQFREFAESAGWRSYELPSGGTRIQVAVPPAAVAGNEFTLELGARSTVPGGRGPLELPRVRPVGSAIADEVWVASVDNETMIRPGQGRGLAWIDPKDVVGPTNPPADASEAREALAWRWISDQASATIDREPTDDDPRASIKTTARVDSKGHRLFLDGRIVLDAVDEAQPGVPIWVNQSGDPWKSWRFRAESDGPALEMRPADRPGAPGSGLPVGGSARNIALEIRPGTSKTILFHAEVPWTSPGAIPLLSVVGRYRSRGVIAIEVPPGVRSHVDSEGLRRLERPAIAPVDEIGDGSEYFQGGDDLVPATTPVVQSFAYTNPASRLELTTQPVTQLALGGMIQEAVLTTTARPGHRSLNRLRLLIQAGEARSLRVKAPRGVSIVRLRRDGLEIGPIASDSGLSIPLENTGAGSKISTIVLDYDVEAAAGGNQDRWKPTLPQIEMPCLSFIWEVLTPSGWEPWDWRGGLIASEPPPDQSNWPFTALGIGRPWSVLARGRKPQDDSRLYAELDRRLVSSAADTISFGEWFARWDSGERPVVIDRLSLDLAGLGPKSPCVLSGVASNDRSDRVLATLKRNGLALVPFHDALLITTDDQAPEFREDDRFGETIAETLVWGADRTDRLQTVARWRGELSTKSAAAGGEALTEQSRLVPGWSRWRFSSLDWPSERTSIGLVNMRARIVSAWLVAGILFIAYLLARKWLGRWRTPLALCWIAAALVLDLLLPARWESHTAAAMISGLAAVLLEQVARRFSRGPLMPSVGAGSREVLAIRAGSSLAVVLCLGLLVSGLESLRASEPLDRRSAILALFPDDAPAFDPNRPLDKVILRLADYNRLERLAREASLEAAEPALVRALSAFHRVVRENARTILVESEYELIVRGRTPGIWEIPVSSTRDIALTLDGKSQAFSIKPGGLTAVVDIPPSRHHVLRVRRTASTRTLGQTEVLRVPCTAMPLARVMVERSRDGAGGAQLVTWGQVERRADQSLEGRLGPVDRIEIRWPKVGAGEAAPENGAVDGLILWDIHPAGDRVRARFRVQQIDDGRVLRIRHDPNLILRSAEVSGLVDGFWVESGARDEWTLHAEPPLGPGSTVSIDCWMPLAAERAQSRAALSVGGGLAGSIRRMPRFQVAGIERYSGIFGVRRPGNWTGRVDSLPPAEPVGDESFVRAWGNLSDEPLTLCGTGRFAGECAASLRTGPSASRIQIKPNVQLKIESGRVAMTVDAEIAELAGHSLQLELQLPEKLQIVEVTGDGLTSWKVASDRRLRLIFDGPLGRPRRIVRIAGWIPLSDDPFQTSPRERRLKTPWIGGDGIEFATGFLTVSSASKISAIAAPGLTLISSESSPAVGSMPPRHRYSYQVVDPQRLGQITWEPLAPRVSVAIESQLTLYPDSAEWVAVLRYDVSGGALDAIHLRMPASWATAAEIDLKSGRYHLSKEPAGPSSIWTITPDHPIRGSERLVLRSTLPLPAERELIHPELAPLGWGAFDAYVGVVNATGRSLAVGKSTGLQNIPYSTKFRSRDFVSGFGTPLAAYRVMSKEWLLQVPLPRNGSQVEIAEQARVALADLSVTVSWDGSVTGRAVYDLYGGGGRLLSFELPSRANLLGVTIDSNPVQPLKDSARRWSVSLENRNASRVSMIWRTPAIPTQAGEGRARLELPRAGFGQSPALLAVHVAPRTIIDGDLGGLEPATPSRYELARADRLGRGIADLVTRIDRTSGRDHEKLISLLINQELALRDAERSVRWSKPSGAQTSSDRVKRELALIESARNNRLDVLRRAGLAGDFVAAQSYLGQTQQGPERSNIGVPEFYGADRIRSPGDRTTFVGVVAGLDAQPARSLITIESPNRDDIWRRPRLGGLVLLFVLLGTSLLSLVPRGWARVEWLGPPLILAVAGYWGGPVVLIAALAITAVAWGTGP